MGMTPSATSIRAGHETTRQRRCNPQKEHKAMPEKSFATQPAREITPFKFEEVEKVFDRMQKTYDSIARRAFELFESNGQIFGRDLEDWFEAEKELLHPVHINISETEGQLQVKAEVPGFSAKELEVSVEPCRLTITGKRETKEERAEGKTVYSEYCANEILRVVDLPAKIDTAKVTATLKDGILEFAMPKAEPAKKVRIETKAA
jgi:HSP20 family protein